MTTQELTIDEEFATLLGETEDDAELEKSLEDNGCLDPILTWANHGNTIIDGHRRYEICRRRQIPFKVRRLHFGSRGEVLQFIYTLQAARRNLSPQRLSYIRGKVYNEEKMSKVEVATTGGKAKSAGGQVGTQQTTAEKVAAKFAVSPRTIKRDGKFARQVDKLPPEEKKMALKLRRTRPVVKPQKRKAATEAVKRQTIESLLERARKQGPVEGVVFKEWLNDTGMKMPSGLELLHFGNHWIVEKTPARAQDGGRFIVKKALATPANKETEDPDLLVFMKRRILASERRITTEQDLHELRQQGLELCDDLLELLKDVEVPRRKRARVKRNARLA